MKIKFITKITKTLTGLYKIQKHMPDPLGRRENNAIPFQVMGFVKCHGWLQ